MDNEYILKVLQDIGFEEYYDKFIEEGFSKESFQCLQYDCLKDILPKAGPRNLFWAKYKTFYNIFERISEATTLSQSTVSATDSSDNFREARAIINTANEFLASEEFDEILKAATKPEGTVEDYLKCANGLIVSNYYKHNKTLLSVHRNSIANIIISKELENLNNLSAPYAIKKERFLKLADEITKLFPSENREIYFVPYNSITRKIASGKLWEVFNYFKKREKLSKSSRDKEVLADQNLVTETPEGSIKDLLAFLRTNFEPHEKILDYWKKTSNHRLKDLSKKENYSIHEYLQEYPALKGPKGHFLIVCDFEILYPKNSDKLCTNWDDFNKKVTQFACKKKISGLPQITVTSNDIAAFIFLPYLLPYAFGNKRNSGGKRIRYTISEITSSLYLHVKESSSLFDVIKKHKDSVRENNETVQPLIVFVGSSLDEIISSYVIINEVIYRISSPLVAIDTCLKTDMIKEIKVHDSFFVKVHALIKLENVLFVI